MTFAVRQISLQFSGASNEPLNLDGLRCVAVISNPGGYAPFGQLQLKVYGMTLDQMNLYSGTTPVSVALQNLNVTLSAGNEGEALKQVFKGGIINSYIDFSSLPDVSFNVAAVSAYFHKGAPSAANNFKGAQTAQNIIKALAPKANLAVVDNSTLQKTVYNQVLSGSIIDQIVKVSIDSALPISIENDTITMWDNGGTKKGAVININPQNGLVGYPSYWEAGLNVKSEFNPNLSMGVMVNLTSSIVKSNGQYPIMMATHEISTLAPDGAWFTTMKLSPSNYLAQN